MEREVFRWEGEKPLEGMKPRRGKSRLNSQHKTQAIETFLTIGGFSQKKKENPKPQGDPREECRGESSVLKVLGIPVGGWDLV